ncbi:recombinase [Candidatus Saccharibacteria bacterium]|nr:recombinase [Candidatus Saccharibacteria bacterium]
MKQPTRSQLVKKLDKVFSQYIRLSESDENGYGNCITCGTNLFWKQAQACHFYTRGRYPTRWDEDNVHYGCFRCNVLLKGNYINYTRYMLDSYSREFVDELEIKSQNGTKIPSSELKEKIEYYTEEVKKLKEEKGLL